LPPPPSNPESIPDPIREPLPRRLTRFSLWLLMVNGVVGAGIFGLPGEVARLAGSAGVWIFPICAVLILPIVLVFAHLGSRFVGTGGPILYTGTAFGSFVGFQTGWAFYVARLTAFAANINLLVSTLAWFWPGFNEPLPRIGLLLACVTCLAFINTIGAQRAMGWLGVITLLKFLPMLAVVGVGLFVMQSGLPNVVLTTSPTQVDMGAAILLVLYAFVGFESGLVPAGEATHPQRDIPRALLAAVLSAAILYIAIQVVCTALLPDLVDEKQPLVAAGMVLFGTVGGVVMTLGVAASVSGNLLGAMFSTPRITYRLALEGQLPALLGHVSPTLGTPVISIVFFAVLSLLLAASGTFVLLASLSVVVRLMIYVGCIAAVRSARVRAMEQDNSLVLPGGLLIPGIALVICMFLLWQVSMSAWLLAGALLGAGSLLYGLARIRRAG
jgi:amino acid transporter